MHERSSFIPFSEPAQVSAPSEQLFEYACALDTVMEGLRQESDEHYEWLQANPVRGTTCAVVTERDQREKNYWTLQERIGRTISHQEDVMSTLEQVENGEIDTQVALDMMVVAQTSDETPKESKRRAAIRKQLEKEGILNADDIWYLGLALGGLSSLASDARRITTGRDRTRLVATEALDSFNAPAKFFDATADTHGGKSRHNGKDGRYYTSASGKRIRKR